MSRVEWGFAVSVLALPAMLILFGGPAGTPIAAIVALFTTMATAVGGSAVYVWARNHRCFSIWPFLAGGALAGLVLALPFAAFASSRETLLMLAKAFGGIGAFHGALFWVVAIWGNDEIRTIPVARDYTMRNER